MRLAELGFVHMDCREAFFLAQAIHTYINGNAFSQKMPLISSAILSTPLNVAYIISFQTKSSGGFFQQGKGRPHQTQSLQQQRHAMSDTLAKEFYNRSSKGKRVYAAKKAARRKKLISL